MTIETEIAALTTATTSLLTAVNVQKATLDAKVTAAEAAEQTATEQAALVAVYAGNAEVAAGAAALDRLQTGLDRQTATEQAATATAKAGEAAISANAAAAALDAFDDRFLGAKASVPALDNDGNALQVGALYWDTALAALRVWTGSAWTNTSELDDRVLADHQISQAEAYALDLLGRIAPDLLELRGTLGSTDRDELFALALTRLGDLVGVVARAISGGDILLRAGSAANPSLSTEADRDTGLYFPADNALGLAVAGLLRLYIDSSGRIGIGTSAPSGLLDVADDKLRVRTAKTPASASASGNAGEVCWDANYMYVCVATNVWKRTPISTW